MIMMVMIEIMMMMILMTMTMMIMIEKNDDEYFADEHSDEEIKLEVCMVMNFDDHGDDDEDILVMILL